MVWKSIVVIVVKMVVKMVVIMVYNRSVIEKVVSMMPKWSEFWLSSEPKSVVKIQNIYMLPMVFMATCFFTFIAIYVFCMALITVLLNYIVSNTYSIRIFSCGYRRDT
jgi:hypothetical protein